MPGKGNAALPAALVALFALGLYLCVAWHVVHDSWVVHLDRDIHDAAQAQGSGQPLLLRTCAAVSDLGGTYFRAGVAVLVAARLCWRRQYRTALIWIVAVVGAGFLNYGLKAVFARARPTAWTELDGSHSFASGHAMGATVLYGLLAYLVVRSVRSPWARWPAVLGATALIILIALSRIYLGRHWASDVVGGLALGAAWTAATIAIMELLPIGRTLPTACERETN